MKVCKKTVLMLCIFTCVITVPVFASDMQSEINHLLAYLQNSECQFERNGKIHSANDTAAHAKRKYNYFKDRIDSTEKFIEYSATKSTMSGKYYMVMCKDKSKEQTRDWLLQELKNYRSKDS
jgi:Family of unknown function (DUF5329)